MKIVIVGAGLIGLTSAYFLKRGGHEVTVIDREEGPGRETSFANGTLLSPSMPEPWNAPGSWRVLLASLVRSDSAMQLRLRALPGLMPWGIRFLGNSSTASFQRNTLANLRLALHSLRVMASVREQTGIEYGRTARGVLRLFRDTAALERACAAARVLSVEFRRLSRDETVALEPAFAPLASQLTGAVHYPIDETGDAYRFCQALAEHARREGVEFRFRTTVASIEVRSRRVTALVSGGERFQADRYLIAAGSHSTSLLRTAGAPLPVQPVRGYSVTFDRVPGPDCLRIPVVDDDFHAVVVPLGEGVRVAGTAEFGGYDMAPNPDRIRNLLRLLQQVLPQVPFDSAAAKPWWGLRPMSADGVPIIGPTNISNLWVSTGHGHLGWTMAAGSAQLLADLIDARTPALDPSPYAPQRFSKSLISLGS